MLYPTRSALAAALLIALATPTLALAQPPPSEPAGEEQPIGERDVPERGPGSVPLLQNFSPLEIGIIGAGTAGALFLGLAGPEVLGYPETSMGPPDRDSVDYRFAVWSNPNPDPDKRWIWGIPDFAGYLAPAFLLSYYGAATLWGDEGGDGIRTRAHEFVAFSGALAFTQLTMGVFKVSVGRERPYVVRPELDAFAFNDREREHNLSFPSGHTATMALTATFLFMQLSDDLIERELADWSPAARYGVGYILPLTVALGATASVIYSRSRDQAHWLSDSTLGALVGAGWGAYFYARHFDNSGLPLRRRALDEDESSEVTLIPSVGAGSVSLGVRAMLD